MISRKCDGIISGVRRVARLLEPIFFSSGNILMDRFGVPTMVVDPRSIIFNLEFDNRAENAGLKIIKSLCREIDNGNLVLLSVFAINNFYKIHKSMGSDCLNEIFYGMMENCNSSVISCNTNRDIKHMIDMYSPDPDTSTLIHNAINSIGVNGNIVVEVGKGVNSEFFVRDGMEIPFGFPDIVGFEHLDQPLILLISDYLSGYSDIKTILEEISTTGYPFIIFCRGYSNEIKLTWDLNKTINGNKWFVIKIETNDFDDWINDISCFTVGSIIGGNYGSVKEYDNSILGSSQSIEVFKDKLVMVDYDRDKPGVDARIKAIRSMAETQNSSFLRDKYLERASRLDGGYCVFRVGGMSEVETIHNRSVVETAIKNINSSIKGGYLLLKTNRDNPLNFVFDQKQNSADCFVVPFDEFSTVMNKSLSVVRNLLSTSVFYYY